jgi:ribosomal-protein-alanine N-acetyltransferase
MSGKLRIHSGEALYCGSEILQIIFPMLLETERLILNTWDGADWMDLRPIATDPDVMRYITGGVPWTDEQIQNFVDRQVKLYADRGFCRWKLFEKSDGKFVGFCGVGFWRDVPDPEIGWWLARDRWGRGLATEAARVALHDAFERLKLERLISIAVPENVASTGIMRKLGLTLDFEFENGGIRLVRYMMTRDQYASRAMQQSMS